MANYKVGLETRKKILQVTRTLFYEKGYIKTTYADICKSVGISQGTFHYHFKNKIQLAKILYWDIYNNHYDVFRRWVDEKNDRQLMSILANRIHWYKFLVDEKYRRFFLEVQPDILNTTPEEYFEFALKDLLYPRQMDISDDEYKLNIASFSGIEIALPFVVNTNLDRYDYLTISRHYEKMAASIFLFNPESFTAVCHKADEITQKINFAVLDTTFG
jgi:AcrR family transcriptional regulator